MERNTIPTPGVYYDVPAEEYFTWNAFSKSMVYYTMKSAKHLKAYMTDDEKSDAMILGSLVDAHLLEPELLKNYPVIPKMYTDAKGVEKKWSLNAKVCKEIYSGYIENGFTPIKEYEDRKALTMVESVRDHKAAAKLLEGKKQVALVWNDEETGVLCKGRLDILNGGITDLKTCQDASQKPFQRTMVNFGYHIQGGAYTDGFRTLENKDLDFTIIAVESNPPHCTAVYQLSLDALECGRIMWRSALNKYKSYLKDDPDLKEGYSQFIEPLEIPQWALELAYKEGENVGI